MQLSRLFQLLGAFVLVATLLLVGRVGMIEWQSVTHALRSQHALEVLQRGLVAVEMVSRERGPTNAAMGEESPPPEDKQKALAEARQRTNLAFARLDEALAHGEGENPMRSRVLQASRALSEARTEVDRMLALPKAERAPAKIRGAVYGMVAVVPLLAPVTSASAGAVVAAFPEIGDDVHGARLAAELREYAGLLGSHFTAALVTGRALSPAERRSIDETRGRIAQLRTLLELRLQAGLASVAVERAWLDVTTRYFGAASELADRVLAQGEAGARYDMTAAQFAASYVPDMNSIFTLRDAVLAHAREKATAEHMRAHQVLVWALGGATALMLVLGAALFLLQRRILRPLGKVTRALHALAQDDLQAPLPKPLAQDEMAAVIGAVHLLQVQTQQRRDLEHERNKLIDQLKHLSETDFLTGLPNRRAFFTAAQGQLAAAARHGFGVAVVMMDVDRFKLLNDRRGHAAGDAALCAVADVLRAQLRDGDLAARLGGEEFVVLLGYSDSAKALQFAERLREAIADTPIQLPQSHTVHVTVSLGVADSVSAGLQLDALISAADAAMYGAKQAGRNRTLAAPGGSAQEG